MEATIKAEALRLAKQMMEEEKRSKVQEPELVYHEKRCSKCKDDYGIIGDRYECLLCDGFHLCQKCETTVIHAHALLKIKRLDQANTRELVERRFGKPKPDVRKREEAEKSLA